MSDDEGTKMKRQTYKPKTLEEMAQFLDALKNCVEKMREGMYKNKKDSNFPDVAPSQNEFKGLKREMDVLLRAYKNACQPKAKIKKDEGEVDVEKGKKNIGFNRKEYISGDMVKFINEHKIDEDQPDIPTATKDGRGIFTRALLTSYWSIYIEVKQIKHPNHRKYIMPDDDMNILFDENKKKTAEAAHKLKLKSSKKRKSTSSKKQEQLFVEIDVVEEYQDGKQEEVTRVGFDFATLQMLLTLFVDKVMAVIKVDDKQEKILDNLRNYFTEKNK